MTLEDAKKHLNVEIDFTEDDAYIQTLVDTAEDVVVRSLDVKDEETHPIRTEDGRLVRPLEQAQKLLVGTWYANRESVTFGAAKELPHAYQMLLDLYHDYSSKIDATD